MTTTIMILIALHCRGNNACTTYLQSCIKRDVAIWHYNNPGDDVEELGKEAYSYCVQTWDERK